LHLIENENGERRTKRRRTMCRDRVLASSEDVVVDSEVVETSCIPGNLLVEGKEHAILVCSCCATVGEAREDDMSWWGCSCCLSPYCVNCGDHELDDATGLCTECANPEAKILRRMKKRKKCDP
jgi:hypothetical protein